MHSFLSPSLPFTGVLACARSHLVLACLTRSSPSYVCMCMHVYVYVHALELTHTHTCSHIHSHVLTYTYTCTKHTLTYTLSHPISLSLRNTTRARVQTHAMHMHPYLHTIRYNFIAGSGSKRRTSGVEMFHTHAQKRKISKELTFILLKLHLTMENVGVINPQGLPRGVILRSTTLCTI